MTQIRPKRRFFKTYLVEPFKQLRFGLHVVAVCLGFVVALAFLFFRAFSEQYQQVLELFQVADKAALLSNEVFWRNGILVGVTLLALIATMMFVVIRRTQKMYGPMVSILRSVEELKKGNYNIQIRVRDGDDFQTLVSSLNELAQTLRSRHTVSDPTPVTSHAEGEDAVTAPVTVENGLYIIHDALSPQDTKKSS